MNSSEMKTLVTAKTLAKLLKVSISWVHNKADRLPTVDIDGCRFFRVKESATMKAVLYSKTKSKFKNPARLTITLTLEREDIQRFKEKATAHGVSLTEAARRGLHLWLSSTSNGEKK